MMVTNHTLRTFAVVVAATVAVAVVLLAVTASAWGALSVGDRAGDLVVSLPEEMNDAARQVERHTRQGGGRPSIPTPGRPPWEDCRFRPCPDPTFMPRPTPKKGHTPGPGIPIQPTKPKPHKTPDSPTVTPTPTPGVPGTPTPMPQPGLPDCLLPFFCP